VCVPQPHWIIFLLVGCTMCLLLVLTFVLLLLSPRAYPSPHLHQRAPSKVQLKTLKKEVFEDLF
jgi:hypothetical protein